jgi:hypothetical protein
LSENPTRLQSNVSRCTRHCEPVRHVQSVVGKHRDALDDA